MRSGTRIGHVALALLLAAGGFLLGRGVHVSAEAAAASRHGKDHPPPPRASRAMAANAAAGDPTGGRRDYASLSALWVADDLRKTDVEMEAARLSIPELKAGMLGQMDRFMAIYDTSRTHLRFEHKQAASQLLEELHRREGAAALEWGFTLEKEPVREIVLEMLVQLAIRQDVAAALPWVKSFQQEYGERGSLFPLHHVLDGPVAPDADEIIRLCRMMPDTRQPISPQGEYPADFDFAKLYRELGAKFDLGRMVGDWAARDREAAWEAVKEHAGDRFRPSRDLFEKVLIGTVASDGETPALEWAVARIQEAPPESRQAFLRQMANCRTLTAEGFAIISAKLGQGDLEVFTSALMDTRRGSAPVISALGRMPRTEMVALVRRELGSESSYLANPELPIPSYETRGRLLRDVARELSLTGEEVKRIQDEE